MKQRLEKQKHKAQVNSPKMVDGVRDQRSTFWDFNSLGVQGITSNIACPNVKAHSFELKPYLIYMVQPAHFDSAVMEDPNL